VYTEIFERCIVIILKHEGGYVNNPNDFGGETKYGIAKRFFPHEDIKNLTIERAKYLYFHSYWLPMKLDGIIKPENVLEIFDMGVNAGKGNAIRIAQRVVKVDADGFCGPMTKAAINTYKRIGLVNGKEVEFDFLHDYKMARVQYYLKISNRRDNKVFLKGWLNRVSNCHF